MQPRIPMQGGMGPRMMGPQFGGRGPSMGMGMGMPQNRGMMNPMMGRRPQMGQGGGFLSKILGKGNQGGGMGRLAGMQAPARATSGSGSFLQTLSNPGGLSSILNNTQQVLRTAQSIGPMIQQYGPIVKNLPAMWKLYRGLKDSSNDTDSAKDSKIEVSQSETYSESSEKDSQKHANNITSKKNGQTTSNKKRAVKEKGASVPKLYI
ncbi:VrrA/YqfQ family protein [Neobacillus sp. PS3-40]|uniref:VrrA/YqfQ family protein n=1 Tax=Neobacillus sp. PS3-40 TaxID=3070679 RepID=UPI0027E1C902|nr:VrrA/YqfQ family protein [Neobacillus sp. PS3-40]WML45332.1 VrrA/YqfQ family protein [Neobacillus sp. PS3-40]